MGKSGGKLEEVVKSWEKWEKKTWRKVAICGFMLLEVAKSGLMWLIVANSGCMWFKVCTT